MPPAKASAPATASTVTQGRELDHLGGDRFLASPDKPQNQPERTAVPGPQVADPVRTLRRAIKYIGRYCGLKCVSLKEARQ